MLGPERPMFKSGLKSTPAALTPEQAHLVRQFVARVGGIDSARQALELLALLSSSGQGHSARSPR